MHIEIGSEGTDSVRADAGGRALETARLRLLPSYLRDCEALRLGAAAFRNKCGLAVAGGVTDFLHPASKDAVVALTWDSFLVIHRVERTLIGLCACQKRPDTAGAVEIAYGIAPDFRGKGLATETVRSLTQHVISRRDVKAVIAHTHPEFNASTRVLAKCGFTQVGEAMDSDEGRVWKWEFPRTDDGARN
jgi:GNAT superfamily N-acetyltransferase